MKRLIFTLAIALLSCVSANAQMFMGNRETRATVDSHLVDKLKNDGWIETKSYRENTVGAIYTEKTWIKAVRQGGMDMIIAIIPELESGQDGNIVTKNPDYNDYRYEGKPKGKYSHKFSLKTRGGTYYLDLDFGDVSLKPSNVSNTTPNRGGFNMTMLLWVLIPILLGISFYLYFKARKR